VRLLELAHHFLKLHGFGHHFLRRLLSAMRLGTSDSGQSEGRQAIEHASQRELSSSLLN